VRLRLEALEDVHDVVLTVVYDHILEPWDKGHAPKRSEPEADRRVVHAARQMHASAREERNGDPELQPPNCDDCTSYASTVRVARTLWNHCRIPEEVRESVFLADAR